MGFRWAIAAHRPQRLSGARRAVPYFGAVSGRAGGWPGDAPDARNGGGWPRLFQLCAPGSAGWQRDDRLLANSPRAFVTRQYPPDDFAVGWNARYELCGSDGQGSLERSVNQYEWAADGSSLYFSAGDQAMSAFIAWGPRRNRRTVMSRSSRGGRKYCHSRWPLMARWLMPVAARLSHPNCSCGKRANQRAGHSRIARCFLE